MTTADYRDPAPSPALIPVARHDLTGRRVWAVGDLHGRFEALAMRLEGIGFDPGDGDCLVLTGIVGPNGWSNEVADWLEQPWLYAVRGDREQQLIDSSIGLEQAQSYSEYARAMRSLAAMPLAREIWIEKTCFGAVHADVPLGMSWDAFYLQLSANNPSVALAALSGRARARAAMERNSPYPSVRGVDWLIVGHSPINRLMVGRTLFLGGASTRPLQMMELNRLSSVISQ